LNDQRQGNLRACLQPSNEWNYVPHEFQCERDAEDWLYAFLLSTGLFHIHRQVHGVQLFRHQRQEIHGNIRCDLLLLPRDPQIIDAGLGAMIVEVKRAGVKIGPGISQMTDYLRCVFSVDSIDIKPRMGFLFPCAKQALLNASWMQQQHIGGIFIEHPTEHNGHTLKLNFYSGEQRLMTISQHGKLTVKKMLSGRKAGSR
jgi:hypothetical protein